MRLLIDMDGVVADFVNRWIEIANYRYKLSMTPADITKWEMHQCTGGAITKRQANKLIWESGFFRHMKPIAGAMEALEQLHEDGHDIYFVTACKAGGFQDKEDWLKDHLSFEPWMVYTEHKYVVSGDVLVDDKVSNLDDWRVANPNGMAVCFSAPYNQDYRGNRARNWDEVLKFVELKKGIEEGYGLPA